jgi:hypothetical protein
MLMRTSPARVLQSSLANELVQDRFSKASCASYLFAEDFKPLLPSFAEAEMPPSRELPYVAERVVV